MSGQTNIAKQHRAGAVEAKAPIDVVMEPRKPREERLCRVFACIRTDGGVCV